MFERMEQLDRRLCTVVGSLCYPGEQRSTHLLFFLCPRLPCFRAGTDASMAVHINNICTRNYVVLGAGRTLAPTELGRSLVHGYHRIDSELVHPAVRSSIEANCALIAAGKARKADVVAHALAVFAGKFAYFVSHIGE